jgi:ribonuclease D
VRWREAAAQRADRPRRWLLDDEALVALAASLPATREDLGKILSARFASRRGAELLAVLAQRSDPAIEALVHERGTAQIPDKARLKALQESVRQRAAALGIEPEILATRRDLAALELGTPPEHLKHGWRARALELPS